MAYSLDREGELRLKIAETVFTVRYRRPEPPELIEALVRKMPAGEEAELAQRILLANLELGRACLLGIGEGELRREGRSVSSSPAAPDYRPDWKDLIAELCPLLLIALGQYLSAAPAFMEEPGLKKS